eukprot:1441560-Prymnesium_polylepis.1
MRCRSARPCSPRGLPSSRVAPMHDRGTASAQGSLGNRFIRRPQAARGDAHSRSLEELVE